MGGNAIKLISSLSERCHALGAAITSARKRPTTDGQTRGLQSPSPGSLSSPTTNTSFLSVRPAIVASTKSENTLFGTLATLFCGRSPSTQFQETQRPPRKSSKRHFGLSHLQRRK